METTGIFGYSIMVELLEMCLFYIAGLWRCCIAETLVPAIKQCIGGTLSTGQGCPYCWILKTVWWHQFEWSHLVYPMSFLGMFYHGPGACFSTLPWFGDHSQQTTCQDVLEGKRFYWYRCRLFHGPWPQSQLVPLRVFVYGCSCQCCVNVLLFHSWSVCPRNPSSISCWSSCIACVSQSCKTAMFLPKETSLQCFYGPHSATASCTSSFLLVFSGMLPSLGYFEALYG